MVLRGDVSGSLCLVIISVGKCAEKTSALCCNKRVIHIRRRKKSKISGWNAYIESLQSRSSAINNVAIFGLDGSIWAKTPDFRATADELKKFANQFKDIDNVPTTGANFEAIHYVVPRVEEGLIFGKKDKTGFFSAKINTAIVIAFYEGDNAVSAGVREAVESIADYLKQSGY